jgi:hypothetical protein
MAANLQTIQAKDIYFNHNNHEMVLGFRFDDLDGAYMIFCGTKEPNNKFDAQIIFSADLAWIESNGKTFEQFVNGSVLPLLNEKIVEIYGAFSGAQDTELWEKVATFCKANLAFNPATGFELK